MVESEVLEVGSRVRGAKTDTERCQEVTIERNMPEVISKTKILK